MQIPIWHKGHIVAYTEVDAEDFDELNRYHWYFTNEGYVCRCTPHPENKTVHMARQILGLQHGDPLTAEHADRNKLNNVRSNLKIIHNGEQAQNRLHTIHATGVPVTSIHRGVSRVRTGRWTARVRETHLGTFDTEPEAAEAARAERARVMPHAQG